MRYLTDDEREALHASGLDPFTPYVITGEVALELGIPKYERFAGGKWENYYTYGRREYYCLRSTDELIREDVVKWVMTRRTAAQRAAQQEDVDRQMKML